MPVNLWNKTNSVEIDINPNLKYTVSKGGYDVIYEDTGNNTPYVYVVLRSKALIDDTIKLDFRECAIMPDETLFSTATELRDKLLEWNIPLQKVRQDVTADDGNSSTTNLSASNLYSFAGTSISTLGVNAIQVSLFADQNCTVNVQQSPDGTNWDIIDTYKYYASTNFGITVQAINSYAKVVVTTNSLTTTVFRLQTCLCPIVEAVPRTLDQYGNFKVAVNKITDLYGFSSENTPMGELRTVIPTRLVGATFEGTTLDSNFWGNSVANNGTVTQANAQVTVATNITSANGSAKLYSVRRARYVSGYCTMFRMVAKITAGATNNKRRWGIAYGATMPTITDGAYFELNGSTFSVVTLKGSAEERTSSGSFNGTMGATYANTTIVAKTYEIYWTNSKVYFVINGEILHTVSATTDTWANTMGFHVYMDSVNSGGVQTNNVIFCRVASIRRLGPLISQPISNYQSGTTAGLVLKYGAGNLHSVIISGVVNNSVVTLYDNTAASGTVIWSSGAMGTNTVPFAIDLKGLPFYTGLTLVIATAASDCTVIYE